MHVCTPCPTESTSLKCTVTLGLVIFNEDPVMTPDFTFFFFPPNLAKNLRAYRGVDFLRKKTNPFRGYIYLIIDV